MPIASAISGIEMPGRVRTSSSACLERVPLPRGRPRRPLPAPAPCRRLVPPPPLPARERRGPLGGAGAPPSRPPPTPARRGGAARAARGAGRRRSASLADAVERGGRRLEAVIFVNDRAKLLQPRVDLPLLLFQEIGHCPALYIDRLTRQSRQRRCRAENV